jgi:hypothetical protein
VKTEVGDPKSKRSDGEMMKKEGFKREKKFLDPYISTGLLEVAV